MPCSTMYHMSLTEQQPSKLEVTHCESDRAASEVILQVFHVGACAHKAQACVGWQARQEVLQHLQVLLCSDSTHHVDKIFLSSKYHHALVS